MPWSFSGSRGGREACKVYVGQEAEDMTRNRVTILCKARVTPTVTVPSVFSNVSLS